MHRNFAVEFESPAETAAAPQPPRLVGDPSIEQHNAGIGTPAHRRWQELFLLRAVGPLAHLASRALLDVRVHGAERVVGRPRVIYAPRHYFEWDAFLLFACANLPLSIRERHLLPYNTMGAFWSRTRARRALARAAGGLLLERGGGADQSALQRAAELLRAEERASVAVYPTGPIGRRRDYQVKPGIGHLALKCPDAAIVPIAFMGVQKLSLASVAMLRRPRVVVAIGEPFTARDLAAGSEAQQRREVGERIRTSWIEEEKRHSGDWDLDLESGDVERFLMERDSR